MEPNVGLDEVVIVLHLAAAVTASQQAAAVVPVTPGPLFWVLAATVPSPAEQSISVLKSVFPVHLPVIAVVHPAYGVSTAVHAAGSAKAPTVEASAPWVQTLPAA